MISSGIFIGTAYAQSAGGGPAPSGIGAILSHPLFMMTLIFGIIYFLIMRPQQKKQREHQQMLRELKRGDKVVTVSGIFGTIAAIDEKTISLQVDDKVRITMNRHSVSALSDEG
jgi:preprotein translocase subunit YajC